MPPLCCTWVESGGMAAALQNVLCFRAFRSESGELIGGR
jgi:hypothetical protein